MYTHVCGRKNMTHKNVYFMRMKRRIGHLLGHVIAVCGIVNKGLSFFPSLTFYWFFFCFSHSFLKQTQICFQIVLMYEMTIDKHTCEVYGHDEHKSCLNFPFCLCPQIKNCIMKENFIMFTCNITSLRQFSSCMSEFIFRVIAMVSKVSEENLNNLPTMYIDGEKANVTFFMLQ